MSKRKRRERRYKYFVTGNNTVEETTLKDGYVLEFNKSLQMWRINHPKGVPLRHMGYSPHRKSLVESL